MEENKIQSDISENDSDDVDQEEVDDINSSDQQNFVLILPFLLNFYT